jgi:Rne/Rng family ribonuclease
MQSSFVDIGLERDAFLYVSEVVNTVAEFDRLEAGEEDEDEAPAVPGPVPAPVALGADGAAIEPEAARPTGAGRAAARRAGARGRDGAGDRERAPEAKIEDLLKEGQEVLVQVVKEPLGTKGARLTSHVTMPGRFLVFMPTVDHIGVSRKIESRDERARLRGIVRVPREHGSPAASSSAPPRPAGPTRTSSATSYFQQVWTEIQRRSESRGRRRCSSRSRASSPSCCATC